MRFAVGEDFDLVGPALVVLDLGPDLDLGVGTGHEEQEEDDTRVGARRRARLYDAGDGASLSETRRRLAGCGGAAGRRPLLSRGRRGGAHAGRVGHGICGGRVSDPRRRGGGDSRPGRRRRAFVLGWWRGEGVAVSPRFLLATISLGLRSLMLHKLRSLLTALGIIIGVAAVTGIAAYGEGSKKSVIREIQALGAENIILRSIPRGGRRAPAGEQPG